MLIKFSITNFLSFNDKQCFSMEAGKARKNSKRIYRNKNIKLTKCEVIFGANASGKSNLVEAFQFVQDMVVDGLHEVSQISISDKFRLINLFLLPSK